MSKKQSKSAKPNEIKTMLDELERIVEWFEQEDIDVAKALDKYEAGLKKIKEIEKQLANAKVEVEKIEKRFDADSTSDAQ